MKKVLLLCTALALLMVTPLVTLAQDDDSTPKFSMSGSVDAYYHKSLTTEEDAPGTSFADKPGFSLGMVNLVTSYEGEKAGFVGDLVFGPRGEEAVFNSTGSSNIVNQLYAWWKPSESVKISLGNFNTFLGYEVISPTVNFNYSTSYMFSYGPFSHTGLRADFTLGDASSLMLAVMNPTDLTDYNWFNTYTIGAQYGYTTDAGGLWLNVLYGDQDGTLEKTALWYEATQSNGATFQVDLTTGWNLGDSFYLGVNATYNTTAVGQVMNGATIEDATGDPSTFLGFALYPQLTLSDASAIGLRAEYFSEGNGGAGAIGNYDTNGDGSVIDVTLSYHQTIGNLTILPELRLDKTSEDNTWTKPLKYGDSPEGTNSMLTFNLAFIYAF